MRMATLLFLGIIVFKEQFLRHQKSETLSEGPLVKMHTCSFYFNLNQACAIYTESNAARHTFIGVVLTPVQSQEGRMLSSPWWAAKRVELCSVCGPDLVIFK